MHPLPPAGGRRRLVCYSLLSGDHHCGVHPSGGAGPPWLDQEIADAFGLGAVRGPLHHVADGWGGHNRVYRLDTEAGAFAVKRYGRRLGGGDPPAGGFAVEQAAFAGGVPMPSPVPAVGVGDGCWAEVGGTWFRCHEWVDGSAKYNEDTSAAEAEAMGRIVAHLHGLAIAAGPVVPPVDWRPQLEALLTAGRARRAGWAGGLAASLDRIAAFTEPTPPPGEVAGSHGDLNAHNVLFSPAGLRLVDWDAAGPAWLRWERADFAVRWGERGRGRYDESAVRAWVTGYRDGGGTWDDDDPAVLSFAPARFLPWVVDNIEMAVKDPTPEQDEVAAILIGVVVEAPRRVAERQDILARAIRW